MCSIASTIHETAAAPEQAAGRPANAKGAEKEEASSIDGQKAKTVESSTDDEGHQLKDRKESHSKASARKEEVAPEELLGEEVSQGQQVRKHKRVGGRLLLRYSMSQIHDLTSPFLNA